MKVLHIGSRNKFTVPYFGFLARHFDSKDHRFLSRGGNVIWPNEYKESLCERRGLPWFLSFILLGYRAEKIIVHGLFDPRIILALYLQPWLSEKTYWVLYGGDLYTHSLGRRSKKWVLKEFFKRRVIRNCGHIIAYQYGDFNLAKKWYGARGKNHRCLLYPSNLVDRLPPPKECAEMNRIVIQVGNSGNPTNEHIEALNQLIEHRNENLIIYVPLSYGGEDSEYYVRKVVSFGQEHFGDKFVPLMKFMPLDDYKRFLCTIDIGLFNHRRQQALGNIRTLLALGRKVYLRPDITSWQTLTEEGFCIYDIRNLKISRISSNARNRNIQIAKQVFSEDRLVEQWAKIFSDQE